ncbi:uncharacterized protein LOC122246280 [Penaeus japonicus]|uniref:uncharacterized protein LOC122246280 n=1 Tax=Penaeus japonicus TaxID=27405 RepID=UPI001C710ED3|nr:uncharacterized protein LOC122246280 [Penaeus japonicus]
MVHHRALTTEKGTPAKIMVHHRALTTEKGTPVKVTFHHRALPIQEVTPVKVTFHHRALTTEKGTPVKVKEYHRLPAAAIVKDDHTTTEILDVDPTEDEGVTQTSYSNGQVTTQSSRIPSQSGAGTQTSQTQRPNQIQMVFQTSSGSNLQFQENTHRGTTTGQCSYVDRTGRTIRISYTKRADGTVNVETNPVVWRPMAAYRSCIAAARDEEKRLNREMSKIESDMRRQEQSIEEEVARQENAAMGGGGSFWG